MINKIVFACALSLLPAFAHAYSLTSGAVLSDGNVVIGVNDTGSLNAAFNSGTPIDGYPSPVSGTSIVGLRYAPTGNEATSHGCVCEGWGVGIGETGQAAGDGSDNTGSAFGIASASLVSTATTATSTVVTTFGLTVVHDFALATETDDLYRVKVTITNNTGSDIADLRYTRAMDWDVEPTTFNEYSTIQGTAAATNVLYADDNGFASTNPFASRSPLAAGAVGDFVDSGPTDHGAIFDFGFGALAAGDSFSFDIFYGGAKTEREALIALAAVGAEVYSFGQISSDPLGLGLDVGGNPSNTFIFGFAGVGGEVVRPPEVPVPAAGWLLLSGFGALGVIRRRKRG